MSALLTPVKRSISVTWSLQGNKMRYETLWSAESADLDELWIVDCGFGAPY